MKSCKPPPHPASQRGTTLIELMIASGILALGITALVTVVLNMGILETGADRARQARLIAGEELEDPGQHYHRYQGVSSGTPAPNTVNLDAESSSPIPASVQMTYTTQDTTFAGTLVPYKKVKTSLTWTESGATKSLTLTKRIVRLYQ